MHYLSIDCETGGLDPSYSLLEVGLVPDNLAGPSLKQGQAYSAARIVFLHEQMVLSPWATKTHTDSGLLKEIAQAAASPWWAETLEQGYTFAAVDPTAPEAFNCGGTRTWYVDGARPLAGFHDALDYLKVPNGPVVLGGRDLFRFDMGFLAEAGLLDISEGGDLFEPHRRTLDPSTLYVLPTDAEPPGIALCLERAGLEATGLHTSIGDAIDVIRLLRRKLVEGS